MTGGAARGSRQPERARPATVRRARGSSRTAQSSATACCRTREGSSRPLLTVVLAFFIGGIVVLVTTGSVGDTIQTYRAIFRGSGSSWFFEVGSHEVGIPFTDSDVWFPWNTNDFESLAATNLQQTLILWIVLVLTGFAVAFAFRCGLFNIGGQGQYLAGSIGAVIVATELPTSSISELAAHSRHDPRRDAGRGGDRWASPACSKARSARTR